MRPKKLNKLLLDLESQPSAALDRRIAVMIGQAAQQGPGALSPELALWRRIMQSNYTKIAAAVVLIVGIFFLAQHLTGNQVVPAQPAPTLIADHNQPVAPENMAVAVHESTQLEKELELLPVNTSWIVENRPYKSIADLLDDSVIIGTLDDIKTSEKQESVRPNVEVFLQIADRITITDDQIIPGRININTAGEVVLQSLPGINEQLANRIIKSRQSQAKGFGSIAQLLAVPGITITQFKELAELITVRSNVFTVHSRGQADRTGISHYIEAVVDRGSGEPKILYWKERR